MKPLVRYENATLAALFIAGLLTYTYQNIVLSILNVTCALLFVTIYLHSERRLWYEQWLKVKGSVSIQWDFNVVTNSK
jgi:cell division protein FtsL